jgi:hypothetical protein
MTEIKPNIGRVFLKAMMILVVSFIIQSLLLRIMILPKGTAPGTGLVFYPMFVIFLTSTLYFTAAYFKPKLDKPVLISALIINIAVIFFFYS